MYIKKRTIKSLQQILNNYLDKVVLPKKHLSGKIWNTYLIWQYLGFAIGTLVICLTTFLKNFSFPVVISEIVITIMISILLFKSIEIAGKPYLALIWARKGIYHYQVVSIISASLFLWIIDQPLLLYLDVLVIGFAASQINGRIGCLKVGCCHGRPHYLGVRYGEKHLESGYGNYLLGVRLLPVQLFEAIWLFFITVASFLIFLSWYTPGAVLSWYILAYSTGRFFFEFLRADTDRLFFRGFSEAQWTAFTLICITAIMEFSSLLPFQLWHAAAGFPIIVMGAAGLKRRSSKSSNHLFLHPYHLRELAGTINWLLELSENGTSDLNQDHNSSFYSGETSLGVQISLAVTREPAACLYKYSLYSTNLFMSHRAARSLANFIIQYRHSSKKHIMKSEDNGVFHILVSTGEKNITTSGHIPSEEFFLSNT